MPRNQLSKHLRVGALAAWMVLSMPGDTPAQANMEERIAKLHRSLLAPCCWAETIAQHDSEVARQMRAEITKFVKEGKSDREILDYYRHKYGARVLVEPDGALWWWMHGVPVAAFGFGIALVVTLLRRWRKPLPA